MLSSAVVFLALSASALGNVFLTQPVGTTTYTAGQPATVSWTDDAQAPALADFGSATFAVYTGNRNQQTLLQTIATSVDVSKVSTLTFTPDASIGPNSNEYFLRVTSLSYKNPSAPQYYEEAFSAKFTLTGMTGRFNATVQAEIDGQSTAPIGATPTPTLAGGPAAAAGALATGNSSTTTASSATGTPSSNGAGSSIIGTGIVALGATLVGAWLL